MTDKDLPVKLSRDFKGIWIPREIWLHPDLSIQAKALWAEIDSLFDEERGGCYASDEYLERFLGVKVSRLHEVMKELKDAGFLEKVSFNGRNRIMKALSPKDAVKKEDAGKQGSGKPEGSLPENRKPEFQETGTLPYNIDTSSDPSIDSPPIPPLDPEEIAKAMAAKAAEEILKDASKEKIKRTRTPADFTPKVREVGEQMVNCLVRSKPNYVPPRNLSGFLTHVDYLLRLDKRDPQLVIDVFSWALADHFWADKMFKPNPAEYLRKQFDQLEMKMNSKPAPKDRKFAPSSNDARSLAKMEEWEKGAL